MKSKISIKNCPLMPLLSRTKKTEIVDVVSVNSVMRTVGGERGKSQGVGQFLPYWGPGWMGIRHQEQEAGPPSEVSKVGVLYCCKGVQ